MGERLAGRLKPGSVIALKGGLGAGKTCLVKGIARGLGVAENVTSPTYTIVSEYDICRDGCHIPLYHIDAYRLNGDEDFENTGAGELIGYGRGCGRGRGEGKGIAIIEWSERIPCSVPPDALRIDIEITGPQNRLFRVYDEPACH